MGELACGGPCSAGCRTSGYVAVNMIWRTFGFESERATTNLGDLVAAYLANPLRMGALQAIELGKDLFEILVVGWVLPAYELSRSLDLRTVAAALVLAAAAAGLAALYRWRVSRTVSFQNTTPFRQSRDSSEMLLLGAVALVGAQIPVILALRDAHWSSGFDRYTLQATLGAALLAVALLGRFVRRPLRTYIVLGLIALSVGTHFLNGRAWAEFWQAERELWWQMSWRAPQLQPGTTLLVQMPGEGFYEDYEVWGPANLIYYPDSAGVQVGAEVFTEDTVEKVRVGASEIRGMRKIIGYPRDYREGAGTCPPDGGIVCPRPRRHPPRVACIAGKPGAGRRAVLAYRTDRRCLASGADGTGHLRPPTGTRLVLLLPASAASAPARRLGRSRLACRSSGNRRTSSPAIDPSGFPSSKVSACRPLSRGAGNSPRGHCGADEPSVRHSLCDEIQDTPPVGVSLQAYAEVTRLVCEFD